jgi:hypothetical protein
MKRLSKNKQLNDVLQLQQFLLYEVSGGKLGVKLDASSDIPFVERMKFLTIMQNSALIANKVDPRKEQSGLADLRNMLKDDEDSSGAIGENSGSAAHSNRGAKSSPAGSDAAAAIFKAAAESANYDSDGEPGPLQ